MYKSICKHVYTLCARICTFLASILEGTSEVVPSFFFLVSVPVINKIRSQEHIVLPQRTEFIYSAKTTETGCFIIHLYTMPVKNA